MRENKIEHGRKTTIQSPTGREKEKAETGIDQNPEVEDVVTCTKPSRPKGDKVGQNTDREPNEEGKGSRRCHLNLKLENGRKQEPDVPKERKQNMKTILIREAKGVTRRK